MIHAGLLDYVVHFGLESLGSLIVLFAQTHICRHTWHRVAIWMVFSIATTILTVNLVG